MVDIQTEILIDRPREAVAAFSGDPANAPQWYVNISSAGWQTGAGLAVGARIAFSAAFLGRNLSYVYEVVELVPGQKLVMRTAQGPFPMQTTYTWSSVDPNTTRMTLRNDGKPSGFSKLLAPLVGVTMRAANTKDLKNLKRILESS
ncbi:SRPBCC family protein [Arthrobacter sp. H5]|uniref:SRPBCC family protein n=1 Tax=Arthrobacter sp. H5 TaxID=1267973 RepID=UPI00048095CA|nr:SRPBCC family protein [Arthrobacter sp. H5]